MHCIVIIARVEKEILENSCLVNDWERVDWAG